MHYIGIEGTRDVFENDVTLVDTVIDGAELWLGDFDQDPSPWDPYLHVLFQEEEQASATASAAPTGLEDAPALAEDGIELLEVA